MYIYPFTRAIKFYVKYKLREFIFWKWYLTLGNSFYNERRLWCLFSQSLSLHHTLLHILVHQGWKLHVFITYPAPRYHIQHWQSQCILSVMLLTFTPQWTTKKVFNCFNTLYYLYCHSDGWPSSTEIQQHVQTPPSYYWSLSLLKYHNLCKEKIKVGNINEIQS